MALSDHKIIPSDISTNGVISAPDKLTGTAAENKAVFDKLISADNASVKKRHNDLIDALAEDDGTTEKPTGASQIGATDADGESSTVQEVLDGLGDDKADKVTDATDGNVAQFDEDGNLEDSGHALSEYVVKVEGKGLSTNDYDNTEKQKVTDAYADKHTHQNKGILDDILQSVVDAWNAASSWVSTNGATVLSHIASTVVHITSAERTAWNAKSTVSVSSSGSSTDTVGYITVDGVEKKLAGGGSGGTSNYPDLLNKPKIAGVELLGDKTLAQFGLRSSADQDIIDNGKASTTTVTGITQKKTTLSLAVASWTGIASPYSQAVTISGATANTKVDLQPDSTAIAQMIDDGTNALYVENNNGTLTCYAVGEKPTTALSVQATYYEVTA